MFCLKCGAWLPDDASYCSYCGNPTGPKTEVPAPEPTSGSTPQEVSSPSHPLTGTEEADTGSLPDSRIPFLFFEEENEEFQPKHSRIRFVIPKSEEPLRFAGLFGSLLLLVLPGFGFLAAVIWALGGSRNRNRITLGKAALAVRVLLLVLLAAAVGVLYFFFPAIFGNLLAWIRNFPV